MSEERDTPDRLVAETAAQQHGVVTSRQLTLAGIDKDATFYRDMVGRLHRVHRGVYAVGHRRLSIAGVWMAAVLACGEGAVLSHRSAAALWRLLSPIAGPVDVTIAYGSSRRRPGIRIHRSRSLSPQLSTRREGIPVTTPARTIADLRRTMPPELARKAIRQAEVIGLDMGEGVEAEHTKSELERNFLRFCRLNQLPRPKVNAQVGPFVVDFLWSDRRLIVETDGYRYHRGRQAFEDDRTRDVELRLLGYEVVRFTYRQVMDESARIAAAVRALLTDGGGPPRGMGREPSR